MPSEREQRALDALIVSQLRAREDEVDVEHLPELTDEEREAMDSFSTSLRLRPRAIGAIIPARIGRERPAVVIDTITTAAAR